MLFFFFLSNFNLGKEEPLILAKINLFILMRSPVGYFLFDKQYSRIDQKKKNNNNNNAIINNHLTSFDQNLPSKYQIMYVY
jgi:hypothetical protein